MRQENNTEKWSRLRIKMREEPKIESTFGLIDQNSFKFEEV